MTDAELQAEADKLRAYIRQNPRSSTMEQERLREIEEEIEKRRKDHEILF